MKEAEKIKLLSSTDHSQDDWNVWLMKQSLKNKSQIINLASRLKLKLHLSFNEEDLICVDFGELCRQNDTSDVFTDLVL